MRAVHTPATRVCTEARTSSRETRSATNEAALTDVAGSASTAWTTPLDSSSAWGSHVGQAHAWPWRAKCVWYYNSNDAPAF